MYCIISRLGIIKYYWISLGNYEFAILTLQAQTPPSKCTCTDRLKQDSREISCSSVVSSYKLHLMKLVACFSGCDGFCTH